MMFFNCVLIFLACKYLTNEISESLLKHESSENIETGYNLDERLIKKQLTKYMDSYVNKIIPS